jgi:hypothetical protein
MPARKASRTLLSRLEPQRGLTRPSLSKGSRARRGGSGLRHVIEGKRGLAGGPAKRRGGAPPDSVGESLRALSRLRRSVAASL